ncbi:MAG: hypothetical protein ACTFAL_01325 [Candidatus Electronema sp. V4]|uniref:hypothetical protein n=1 Tax=Candidatus Electronema sp. V4 TaxID=3454756 RepID=UPI0040558894
MTDWMQHGWEIFKVVAPWVTGGLAGAVFTYILNQRAGRHKKPRLLLTTQQVDYAIPSKDKQLQELRVSYRGQPFDSLLLFQMEVKNISDRTVNASPFLLFLNDQSIVVDRSTLVQPLNRETAWTPQISQTGAYVWDASELKPGDQARLRLLVTHATEVSWSWRGDDEVEITSYGRENEQTLERELHNVIAWIAVYILFGTIPFLSSSARALFLVMSSPYIVRYFLRWLNLISGRKWITPTNGPIVVADSTAAIHVATDEAGRSTISVQPIDNG